MRKNYFSIERDNECWSPMVLGDYNGNAAFEEFLDMSYNEMKSSDKLSDFVVAAMDAANRKSNSEDKQTLVTLVGEDDIFVWSILMGPGEDDMIQYSLVDWKKDGKSYRYMP